MQSRLRILGHALHPILVDFPVVLFPLLVGLDILHILMGTDAFWETGWWMASAGLAMAVLAILTGLVDLARIPGETRAHRIAFWHFFVGILVAALYAAAVWLRWPIGSGPGTGASLAIGVDVGGLVVVVVQGWLGGELMERHQVGIRSLEEGADPVVLK